MNAPPARPVTGKVLLIDADAPHARRLERMLRATTLDVHVAASDEGLPSEPWDLVVVNYPSIDAATRTRILRSFPRETHRTLFTCGGAAAATTGIASLIAEHGLTNLLADTESENDECSSRCRRSCAATSSG